MWKVLGASERGVSHERSDIPCQDAMRWVAINAETIVCAVADGLGSAPRSDEGSKLAVETAVTTVAERIAVCAPESQEEWRSLLESAVTSSCDALHNAAAAADEPVESFDTTLIVSVVTPQWIATAHLGDGAVVVWQHPDRLETFSAPERNEFANIVTPITVPNLIEVVRYRVEPRPVDGLALITDGLQTVSINNDTDAPHAGFFGPLFDDLKNMTHEPQPSDIDDLRAFLRSPRINQRTTDDKTLVWAVRGGNHDDADGGTSDDAR